MRTLSKTNAGEIENAMPLLRELEPGTREAIARIWQETLEESRWARLTDCPYAVDRPGVSLVAHHNAVTEGALALGAVEERHGDGRAPFDRRTVIAIGLLHDVSKLVEYEPDGEGCRPSELGRRLQHAVYAAGKVLAAGLPLDVVEVVVNHTPQSKRYPDSPDGLLIYYADVALADLSHWVNGRTLHVAEAKGGIA